MTQGSIHVLLVEDNPDHSELMQRALKRQGSVASVTAAARGSECLELLGQNSYSVVLLDYSLPGMDGMQVLKEIRRRGHQVPVVMITSQGVERVAVEAMEEGASDYVVKAAGYLTTLPTMLSKVLKQHELMMENRRLLEETRRQGRQMALIFASTSDGIVLLDPEGIVAEANGRAEDFFDRPGMMLNWNFLEIVDKASLLLDPAGFHQQIGDLLTSGASEEGLIQFGAPKPLILHWAARPTLDEAGQRLGLTITFRDVTREREVDRMKTEFISTVSHELRTPLTSIKGALQLVMDDPELTSNALQAELLGICLNNTDRLIRLINDILDVSKIESGWIQLKLDTHSVEEFVLTAVEGVRALAAQRGITLELALAEDLPVVAVDLDRMVQVVTNLLSNAIKFSPEGQRVRVEGERVEDEVVIRVRDWGKGIAPVEIPHLFKKFQQLDSSAVREAGGTGLGLAISKGIVEEHRGRIRVDSELGVGSCFVFYLPAATAPSRREARPMSGLSVPRAGESKKKRILVVDDESDIRYILRQHLERLGHEVVEAQSGLEALEKVRALHPDLVTLDVMMPDMDGFDVMAVLKQGEKTRAIPVIFLSVVQDEAKGFRLGATDYITKPIDPDRLLRVIERVLPREEHPQPARILVVDDDPEILTVLGQTLSRAGYDMAVAEDGQSGLSKVYSEVPDLLILDIKMPGMNGYEVIRRIRATRRLANLPILVLTASETEEQRDKALALGATEYLTKPFSAEVLLGEITRLIRSVDGQPSVPTEHPFPRESRTPTMVRPY